MILRATIFALWLLLSDQWFAVVLCKKVEQPDDRPHNIMLKSKNTQQAIITNYTKQKVITIHITLYYIHS